MTEETEEPDVEVEFSSEDDEQDDIALQHGSLFIPNASWFFEEYSILAVWNDVNAGPVALVDGRGAMSFNELIKDAAKRKLKPV